MREFKFRGWCAEDNKMWDWHELRDTHPLGCLYTHHDLSWVVMQYTGLKDKNGKEIYEGDVVEYKKLSFHEDGTERGFIEYNEYAEWAVNNWLLNKILKRAEVIGNIYENPELLEERK